RLPTARMDRPPAQLAIIQTLALLLEVLPSRLLTAAEVPRKLTIPIPVRMLKPGKDRVLRHSGEVLMCRVETRAQQRDITQPPTGPLPAFQVPRAERRLLQARLGGTARPRRLQTAICMPGMMAMFTRIPATA